MATILRNLKLNRCDLVDQPANPKAHVVIYKSAEAGTLPSGERTALPDSAFAAVWTDADGNKQRKLPYKHSDGSIDLAHLRNALARLSQTDLPTSVRGEARRKLESARETHLKEKQMSKSFWKSVSDFFKAAQAEAGPLADWAAQEEAEPEHPMKALFDKLCKAMEGMELPEEHPLKALHKELGDMVAASAAAPLGPIAKKEEPVSKREEELAKRLEGVEKTLQAERDTRALADTTVMLAKFKGVSIDPAKDAPIFKKLAESDKPSYDRILELLNGAEAVVAKSQAIEKEIGSPLEGTGAKNASDEAWAAIDAEATAMVQKDVNLTKEKAIDLVMKKRPDLVKQHLSQ